MTAATIGNGKASPTPGRVWLVGITSLLWNAFGGWHYVMIHRGGDAYMRAMGSTDAQIAHFHALPDWMLWAWALGVWPAVLGSLLLLVRSKWALHAFAVALVAMLASAFHSFVLAKAAATMGAPGIGMSVLVTAIGVLLVWCAWAETKAGVLR